jgi:hypothetical protein
LDEVKDSSTKIGSGQRVQAQKIGWSKRFKYKQLDEVKGSSTKKWMNPFGR